MDSSQIEIIKLYQTQVDLTDKIWWYFATVSLGVLGFVLGSEHAAKSRPGMIALAIGYLTFAIGNACSLFKSQTDLLSLSAVLDKAVKSDSMLQGRFHGLPAPWVLTFQIALAAAVICVLGWFVVQAGKKTPRVASGRGGPHGAF